MFACVKEIIFLLKKIHRLPGFICFSQNISTILFATFQVS